MEKWTIQSIFVSALIYLNFRFNFYAPVALFSKVDWMIILANINDMFGGAYKF